MTSTTINPEIASTLRTQAAANLRKAKSQALATYAATPDDKLNFKPSETANSINELMLHLLSGNVHVAKGFGLNLESADGVNNREEIAAALASSTEAIASAIEGLSDEEVSGAVEFFGKMMPMTAYMAIDEWHYTRHIGQIDYIQTIYGDMDNHN